MADVSGLATGFGVERCDVQDYVDGVAGVGHGNGFAVFDDAAHGGQGVEVVVSHKFRGAGFE